ncbi:hypothetical protein FQN54_005151 [Arachnomyces sp. PD_36]|nr:hypothetical protein FQN54_005151 [Arachnomyces sp. PD_36]
MDVLPQPTAEGNGSPLQPQEPREENYEDLPKCFRAIAVLRRNVNTKRVLAGDKRYALLSTLDGLVDAISTLADTSLERIDEGTHDNSEDIKALQVKVNRLLFEFNSSKEIYEKLDAELCTFDDRLADEEIRIYKHLGTTDRPPPSIYNHSFPLRSLPEQPSSQDDLPYGEPSDDGTDPFEYQYGMGASVGMYPRLVADMPQNSSFNESPLIDVEKRIEPDTTITDPRRDKGVSGLVEQHGLLPDLNGANFQTPIDYVADGSESSVLYGTTPEPHPLILDNRSPDRLESYLLDFNNKTERVNQWLLHILRTSPLEVVGLRNSYDDDPGRITMDETAWAKHVLKCWPQDNRPATSDLGPYTKGAVIYGSVDSLEQNLESRNSSQLNGNGSSPVDLSTQLERSTSWHLVSSKDYEPTPHPLASTSPHQNLTESRNVNNLGSKQAVAERPRWPTSTSHPQVLSRGIQWMYRETIRGIKMSFEKKHRPKIPRIPWPTAARKNKLYTGKTHNSSVIAASGHDNVDIHESRLPHRISSSLTVSPSRKTESTSHSSTFIDSSGNLGSMREQPLSGVSNPKSKNNPERTTLLHSYNKTSLEAVHTKSLFPGRVFLLSIDSLVDLDPRAYHKPLPYIGYNPIDGPPSPLLNNEIQELNPLQNKYRDLVVRFDSPEYATAADVRIRLTPGAYNLPIHKQLRLNSTVQFAIPFGVPTLGIGQTNPHDFPKIYQDLEDPKRHANYLPSRLLSGLAREGRGQLYSFDKGYASAYIEPDLFWGPLSQGSLTSDDTDPPRYSTAY